METLQRTANRGSISTGYDIDNSLKLESDNSEYLDNRHHSAGNRRTWTLSFWIKRTELGTTQKPYDAGNAASIAFLNTDKIQIENSDLYLVTDRVFRDTSAWYHIVQLNDSTQSTASNRAKLWINGVQETSFSSETYMAQNQEGNMNSATSISIGGGGGAHVNGYMAELFFVDGQALAPTDFGEFDEDSGIWKPKEYDGTLSGTSIKLDFSDSSALWTDSSGLSGNGTSMSGNNITSADQSTDTPTNNFCTWNPLYAMTYPMTISEGGTKTTANGSVAQWQSSKASMAVNNGKWYWETSNFTELNTFIGIQSADANTTYGVPYSWNLPLNDNSFYIVDPNGRTESFATTKATTDVWAIALNMDDGEISFYRNGTQQNSTVSIDGLIGNGPYVAIISQYASAGTCSTNFGGYNSGKAISSAASDANGYGTFEYAPPTGYYAICTKNLAEYG